MCITFQLLVKVCNNLHVYGLLHAVVSYSDCIKCLLNKEFERTWEGAGEPGELDQHNDRL